MPIDMNEFPQILRRLVSAARLDETGFVLEMSRRGFADHRTATSWLGKGAAKHAPTRDKQEKIIKYFREKLGLEELRIELLSATFAEFETRFEELLSSDGKKKDAPVALPFMPQPLTESNVEFLCGTYHLYRYSLQGDENKINREVLVVRDTGDPRVLDVEVRSIPPRFAHLKHVSPAQLEVFRGTIWRFGGMFSTFLYFEDDANRDRRFRHMCFPLLRNGRDTHYGLIVALSAHLAEPIAARVIATRISEKDILQQEIDAGMTGPLPHDHPDVKNFIHLLNNKDDDGNFTLTVDHRKTPLFTPRT